MLSFTLTLTNVGNTSSTITWADVEVMNADGLILDSYVYYDLNDVIYPGQSKSYDFRVGNPEVRNNFAHAEVHWRTK